ncbi:Nonribosomal peptide synthetase [Tolypocladium capitatum]|uniref:Nonribosomal peptide synthetase n=1 Tax=Tolypocladium capitatum TaxID=45235 RepID=A0A2K3QPQ4_9HYPO|nr:Nonribosomal peptide synthetase [Tolypocladium capitatum]
MKVVGLVRESGATLTTSDLFGRPRLADLALTVRKDVGDSKSEPIVPFCLLEDEDEGLQDTIRAAATQCGVDVGDIKDIYPCTPMQEALLALCMKQQGDYVAKLAFGLPINVDIGRLHSAWQAVCDANLILRYIGPKDGQVKLNNQCMEPEEVESQLKSSFPADATVIIEAVVLTSSTGHPRLFAFVHLGSEGHNGTTGTEKAPVFLTPDESFISMCRAAKARLLGSLPHYMIPGAFILLNHIPEMETGKIDRPLLSQAAGSLSSDDLDRLLNLCTQKQLPSNDKERKRVDLWAELLKSNPITMSLLAMLFM